MPIQWSDDAQALQLPPDKYGKKKFASYLKQHLAAAFPYYLQRAQAAAKINPFIQGRIMEALAGSQRDINVARRSIMSQASDIGRTQAALATAQGLSPGFAAGIQGQALYRGGLQANQAELFLRSGEGRMGILQGLLAAQAGIDPNADPARLAGTFFSDPRRGQRSGLAGAFGQIAAAGISKIPTGGA